MRATVVNIRRMPNRKNKLRVWRARALKLGKDGLRADYGKFRESLRIQFGLRVVVCVHKTIVHKHTKHAER